MAVNDLPAPTDVDGTTVHTRATSYSVSCLPDDPIDGDSWEITVEFRGGVTIDGEPRPLDRQWAVVHRSHWHLSRNGAWDLRTGESDDDWLANHRFDLETALRVAAEQAPLVKVGGLTAAGLLAWRAEQ
jgi:hypothetical protein